MEFLESVLFLFIILILLTTIKSNTFLIIFGGAIYLFFLFQLFFDDSIGIFSFSLNFILDNPWGLMILPVPLIVDILSRNIKKISINKGRKKIM